MNQELTNWCKSQYDSQFQASFSASKGKQDDRRKIAQKAAIGATWVAAIQEFPTTPPFEIWNTIYRVHVATNSGIWEDNTIQAIIAADQSWKKSSGHAFEETIKLLANEKLLPFGIEIVLQKDLSILLKKGLIVNEVRDISWLKEQIKSSVFDLYLTLKIDSIKRKVFGCVQTKTSIRDRTTRDREPSGNAMDAYFFSVAIVLNGDFLRMQKFQHMVNGGSADFQKNGWHGMYAFSNNRASEGRIHEMGLDMEIFVQHTIIASKGWQEQRQWMNCDWLPI